MYNLEAVTESFATWVFRICVVVAVLGSFFVGYIFGIGYRDFFSPESGMLTIFVVAWFVLSSAGLLVLFCGWLGVTLVKFTKDLSAYYKNYLMRVIVGEERLRYLDLFNGFRDLFDDDVLPRFARIIYHVYSWPLVLFIFLIGLLALIAGVFLSAVFRIFDNFVKNRIVKKHMVLALSSSDVSVRQRAERVVRQKKQSIRRKQKK